MSPFNNDRLHDRLGRSDLAMRHRQRDDPTEERPAEEEIQDENRKRIVMPT